MIEKIDPLVIILLIATGVTFGALIALSFWFPATAPILITGGTLLGQFSGSFFTKIKSEGPRQPPPA